MKDNIKDTSEAPIEQWELDKLVPYDKNPKLHSTEHVQKLANSISQHGITDAILVDENGVIIGGHGRRLAAMRLGMKFVPVRVLKHLDADESRALRLSHNRVVGTKYDEEIEQFELSALVDTEVDMTLMGYDDKELEFLTDDLIEMDVSSLVDDLDSEVKEQTERTEARTEEVEAETVKLAEAFGFKTVTVEQAREIGAFMGELEEQTGKKGSEALLEFVSSLINEV